MGLDIRSAPESMDAAWVTDVMESAGVARGARVTAVEFLGYIGTGQTGANGRFAITWDDPVGRPATFVTKFPSRDAQAAMTAFANGTYLKECTFYRSVAPTVGIRAPRTYAVLYDADTPDFVIVMEDAIGCQQGDQLVGLTVDEASLAAAEAVQLHAPRWGDSALAPLLGVADVPTQVAGFEMIYNLTLGPFLERLGTRLDADVVEVIQRFAGFTKEWITATATPHTVVHMDYRPDNLLFGVEPGAPSLVVVDWQTASVGPAMNDLAYLIGGGFLPEQRAVVERGLVEHYRTRLTAEGITYEADTCWRDYRVATLWGIALTVIATVLAAETERGNEMFIAMAQRHGRHAIDLDALSLLR